MSNPPYPCLGVPPDGYCQYTPTYPARECTSGCSWWGSQYTGKPWPRGWGNAANWPTKARAAGFNVTGFSSPNSIMCVPPGVNGAGKMGHVAFVTGSPVSGSVSVIEMNFLIPYGYDYRNAPTANCQFIHLLAPPISVPMEDDMLYLFNAGAPGIFALYFGKYFHVTPDDLSAFEAIAVKPIQTIGAPGHAVLLATYGVPT